MFNYFYFIKKYIYHLHADIFLLKLSLVRILFFYTNHRKILILSGI
jgi:hypothetical protein